MLAAALLAPAAAPAAVTVGEADGTAGTNARRLRIVFPRTCLRAVQPRLRRGAYRMAVRVTAVDAAGNRTRASRRTTVARAQRRAAEPPARAGGLRGG